MPSRVLKKTDLQNPEKLHLSEKMRSFKEELRFWIEFFLRVNKI